MARAVLMQTYDQRLTGDVERARIHHTRYVGTFTWGVVVVCLGKPDGETCHFQNWTATPKKTNLGSKNVGHETFAGNSRSSTGDGTERFKNLPLVETRPNRQIIPFCEMIRKNSHDKATTARQNESCLSGDAKHQRSEGQWPGDLFISRCPTKDEKWTFRHALFRWPTHVENWTKIYHSMPWWVKTRLVDSVDVFHDVMVWSRDDVKRYQRQMMCSNVDGMNHRWSTMESPEPQSNAKEEKRVIIWGGVLFGSVGCACWPLLVFGARGPRNRNNLWVPLKPWKP